MLRGWIVLVFLAAAFSVNAEKPVDDQRCTAIGVGPKAMVDGSTVTTHNNDCQECDLRITHVPAKDWPAGSKRPIYDVRVAYPRYIEEPGGSLNVHGPDYSRQDTDLTIYNWSNPAITGYVDQVPHTFAYTLGSYAIQNEKQVSIGESTCGSVFHAKPTYAEGGKALLHMYVLTEIALERCATARCAIQLMGDLAVKYGFYGPAWDEDEATAQDEAGEALTIADPNETWMFHIMPDDTGSSAIWVAQRVPDGHITAVANQFVIGEIDLKDPKNFLGSSNIYDVAIRNNLWDPDSGNAFNFLVAYAANRHESSWACTRRVWRVFTIAAPSLLPFFSPYTDGLGSFGFGAELKAPYPFSVQPDEPLSAQDIMNINRDQYEGTPFDLTADISGGPFGDPMRFPEMAKWEDDVNGVNRKDMSKGLEFQRPISLWRTAYSTVSQNRKSVPNAVALTWIAPYAPHHSSFVPVYVSVSATPSTLKKGTQYKFDKESNWWVHCMTSNYLSRWYRYTIGDIIAFQKKIEEDLFLKTKEIEKKAIAALGKSSSSKPSSEVVKLLTNFHEGVATSIRDAWFDYFFDAVGRFRDMYQIVDIHVENFNDAYQYVGVPRWWFEQIGYWGAPGTKAPSEDSAVPIYPINVPSYETPEIYQEKYGEPYPGGTHDAYPYPWAPTSEASGILSPSGSNAAIFVLMLLTLSLGIAIGLLLSKKNFSLGSGYSKIPEMSIQMSNPTAAVYSTSATVNV